MATQTTSPRDRRGRRRKPGEARWPAKSARTDHSHRRDCTGSVGAGGGSIPAGWMLSTSLKTRVEVLKFPPTWIPMSHSGTTTAWRLTVNPFGKYFHELDVLFDLGDDR